MACPLLAKADIAFLIAIPFASSSRTPLSPDLLCGRKLGDGVVTRAAREAQRRFRDPPQL
jgi:hypothetical protein